MSWITHPTAIWLRNTVRSMGLARPLRLMFADKSYEAKVDAALFALLRPGDVVWDIGANVGHYTVRMAEAVGPTGHVVAFEPSPDNFQRLREACVGHANITPMQVGLSSTNTSLSFVQGSDDLGATSRLVNHASEAANAIAVQVRRGDDLIAEGAIAPPQVIKVDVEGHEPHVLEGLGRAVRSGAMRACIVEMHFGLLAANGADNAPRALAEMFKGAGFTVDWVDVSHLRAVRG